MKVGSAPSCAGEQRAVESPPDIGAEALSGLRFGGENRSWVQDMELAEFADPFQHRMVALGRKLATHVDHCDRVRP